jgi:hypothetical protein
MEQGAKALLRILIAALLLGAVVVAAVPAYRRTAQALWRQQSAQSPIWQSNRTYYSGITPAVATHDEHPE